jgi:hypothetical protein
MQIALLQRSRTCRADRGRAQCHVVHQHKTSCCEQTSRFSRYFVVRLRAWVPSLALGSCVIAASNTVLHASLISAFFSLRQTVISSALGMNALQSLSTSGVHAKRCSSVPCEREGTGETVAGNKASGTHHCANDVSRGTIHLFQPSAFIKGPLPCSKSIFHIIGGYRYALAGGSACSQTSTFGGFDPARVPFAYQRGRRNRADTGCCPAGRCLRDIQCAKNHQVFARLSKRLGRSPR